LRDLHFVSLLVLFVSLCGGAEGEGEEQRSGVCEKARRCTELSLKGEKSLRLLQRFRLEGVDLLLGLRELSLQDTDLLIQFKEFQSLR
jgi:hypothetical protein